MSCNAFGNPYNWDVKFGHKILIRSDEKNNLFVDEGAFPSYPIELGNSIGLTVYNNVEIEPNALYLAIKYPTTGSIIVIEKRIK